MAVKLLEQVPVSSRYLCALWCALWVAGDLGCHARGPAWSPPELELLVPELCAWLCTLGSWFKIRLNVCGVANTGRQCNR